MSITFDVPALDIPPGEDGSARLKHNSDFMAVAHGWNSTVKTINGMIDKLNGLLDKVGGPQIGKIPWTDLEQTIVFPLSGNYQRIQANANSCLQFESHGTREFSFNITQVSAKLALGTFRGEAATALAVQMEAFALVVEAAGGAISLASAAFDGVATVSEELAVEIEDLLVTLGRKLARVVSKILGRVSSWIGWLALAWDILDHGWHVVTDIIDDITDVIHGIEALIDLKSTVEGWVEQVKADLDGLKQFVTFISELPHIAANASLDTLPPVSIAQIQQTVNDIEVVYGDPEADGQETVGRVGATTAAQH
ncbi:MAG: hypothetical protein QM638_07145 [Nocardioides sp.]|uniref:hypothetical protein n=1 Tax=Nocardioides sp. TaxID=35761 RepID=UPI0039E62336